MFSLLKDRLSAVKKDVTSGVKSVLGVTHQISEDDVKQTSTTHESTYITTINHDISHFFDDSSTAQNLLHRYECEWEKMRNQSEQNASEAVTLAKNISESQQSTEILAVTLKRLNQECCSLPELLTDIQQTTERIADLHSLCALIEDDLSCLENLCDEVDFVNAKTVEYSRLDNYKKMKAKELKTIEGKLENDHTRRSREIEKRQIIAMRQKQNLYQQAFERDMQKYKAAQQLRNTKQSLAQVELPPDAFDAEKLEAFLNSSDAPTTSRSTIDQNSSGDVEDHQRPISNQHQPNEQLEERVDDSVIDVDSCTEPAPAREKRSSSELSARALVSSGDSHELEWDDAGDNLDIIRPSTGETEIENMITTIENELK